jgi:hypothetical protein
VNVCRAGLTTIIKNSLGGYLSALIEQAARALATKPEQSIKPLDAA